MNPVTFAVVADDYIRMALREDISSEDVSTQAICPNGAPCEVSLVAKQEGVIAGLDVFARVFSMLDPKSSVDAAVADGDEIRPGQLLAIVSGDVRAVLSGERTALNYLQRMSGIATKARRMVQALEGTGTRIVDTRKTTPGMRIFEKEAVRIGGGTNHRYNLSTAVMLKDNHIDAAGGIANAVRRARERVPFTCMIEVEAENLKMVAEALEAGADIIMLDNMAIDEMRSAIELVAGRAKTEISGNVDEPALRLLADLGVDYISCGALTHSSPILDLSLKHLRILEGGEL